MNREVILNGTLTCTSQDQLGRVIAGLGQHIALTRAEAGCLAFDVEQTADPMVWTVTERFSGSAAFEAHQKRAAASDWARLTEGIARDYIITGLE